MKILLVMFLTLVLGLAISVGLYYIAVSNELPPSAYISCGKHCFIELEPVKEDLLKELSP